MCTEWVNTTPVNERSWPFTVYGPDIRVWYLLNKAEINHSHRPPSWILVVISTAVSLTCVLEACFWNFLKLFVSHPQVSQWTLSQPHRSTSVRARAHLSDPNTLGGVFVSVLIRACWRCVWGCGPGVFWSFVCASLCFSVALFHSHPQKLTPTR